jgi:hypothetical protein
MGIVAISNTMSTSFYKRPLFKIFCLHHTRFSEEGGAKENKISVTLAPFIILNATPISFITKNAKKDFPIKTSTLK